MRYFAIMNDHTIKPVTNVTKCDSTVRFYFSIDDKMYRYLTLTHDYENPRGTRILIPTYSFQQFVHEDWLETRQVEYLLALDEKENEELNYFQSTDFNAGMLYSVVEKEAVKMLKDKGVLSYSSNYSIPNIQLIAKNCETFNEGNVIDATIRAATEHFEAVYGKTFKLDIYGWQRIKQNCLFFYRISRKEQPKEMTITEIEEALGYKIKVVGEK